MSEEAHYSALITADNTDFKTKIREVNRSLDALGYKPSEVKLSLSAKGVQTGIDQLIRAARSLQRSSAGIVVKADVLEAKKSLSEVQKQLRDIEAHSRINIKISGNATAPGGLVSTGVAATKAEAQSISREIERIEKNATAQLMRDVKERENAVKVSLKERGTAEKQQWAEIRRLELQAVRDTEQAAKKRTLIEWEEAKERTRLESLELRKQKENAAAIARQIEAENKRNKTRVDRFGDYTDRSAARGRLSDSASTGATMAGLGIGAGLILATREAINFEESFKEVRKTVDGTGAELDTIQKQLREMAAGKNPIPIDINELNRIAGAAGQLGIETPRVAEFTAVIAKLSQTTNLTSETAASDLAKLANITQMNQTEFDRLGATVVDLGNKSAATETDIVEMSKRIAGAGHQIGLSEAEILSFGTALSSVGIEVEAGGSAISKTFVDIDKAIRTGGDQLKGFAKVSGMSAAQFKKAYQEDAAGAITRFVEGLGKIQKSGGDVFGILEKLGITEIRQRDSLLRLAGAGDLLNKTLDTGRTAWEKNTALNEEARKAFETTAKQIQAAKNELVDLALDVSSVTVPATRELIKEVRDVLKWFRELTPETQAGLVKLAAYGTGALLVAGKVKKVAETIGWLRTAHFLAGKAATAQATAESTAAATTAGAWEAAALRMNKSGLLRLLGKAGRVGGAVGAGVGLGGVGYWLARESGVVDPNEYPASPVEAARNAYARITGNATQYVPIGAPRPSIYSDPSLRDDFDVRAYAASRPQRSATGPAMHADEIGGPTKEAKKAAREADKAAAKEKAAALKEEIRGLESVAKQHDAAAKAAEDGARRQIAAIKQVSSSMRDLFGSMQEDLLRGGIMDNPLGDALQALSGLMNFNNRTQGVAAHYGPVIQSKEQAAQATRDTINDLRDGKTRPSLPVAPGGSGMLGPADARFLPVVNGTAAPSPGSRAVADKIGGVDVDSLSRISALPEAWGAAVADTEKTTNQYRAQLALVTKEGAQAVADMARQIESQTNGGSIGWLMDLDKALGGVKIEAEDATDFAIQLTRALAKRADAAKNAKAAEADLKKSIQETREFVAQQAQEGADNLAQIEERERQERDAHTQNLIDELKQQTAARQEAYEEAARIAAEMRQLGSDNLTDYEEYQRREQDNYTQVLIDNERDFIASMAGAMADAMDATSKATDQAIEDLKRFDDALAENAANIEAMKNEVRGFALDKTRTEAEQTRAVYADMFGGIAQGAMQMENGVGGALQSILGNLKSMATQFASNWIFNQLMGLVGGGGGLVANPTGPGYTSGSIGGALGVPGHANGLDRVPYDNYLARLHRDEMVVPARDAERLRLGGSGANYNNSSAVYNITVNGGGNPQETARAVGNALSQHEAARRSRTFLGGR